MAKPLLEVRDLHKSYGAKHALIGVSFTVLPGEMFGLLGPNGAGKTTLLSILCGLTSASAGSVQIQGENALSMSNGLRRKFGLVPQEIAVYGELSAYENLRFFGRLYGLPDNQLRTRTRDVLAAIGLAERGNDRVESFSGGMKRRLNLGVALMHEPPLVFLDEPTTGVDPQSRNHLFEEIRRINRAGTTVLYTSHYMEEVQALCTRIGILDRGRLVACDTLPNLLRQMNGLIRLRIEGESVDLARRLDRLPEARVTCSSGDTFELDCVHAKETLIRLIAILNELRIGLVSLETEEPSLERVFLHLTGRALRD